MKLRFRLRNIEEQIVRNRGWLFTVFSFVTVLLISINLIFTRSLLVGFGFSVTYFLINGTFLGNVFFKDEDSYFMRFMLGNLVLVLLLGLASWVMIIIYNLDILRFTIVLVAVTILSSLLSRWGTNLARQNPKSTSNPEDKRGTSEKPSNQRLLCVGEILYLFMVTLLFYLLFSSRSGEVHTVWQVLPRILVPTGFAASFLLIVPLLFLLVFFFSTFLLLAILFSSKKTPLKLFFVILHSILSHSLFIIIFPAGDVGVQQIVLGITRRIFENATLHGYGHSANVLVQIYYWLNGINFQSACSVAFARMVSVDVFWSHLLLVPTLWGTFVPIIAFIIMRTIGGNKMVSILAGLAVSVFPAMIVWGAMSVPNSLGFFFAFISLYFILRYLSSNRDRSFILMLMFSFASLLSHPLTGIMIFSLLLLAVTLKSYKSEKGKSPSNTKMLLIPFVLSVSLLPMALIYHRLLSPLYANVSLDKVYDLSPVEFLGMFAIGEYFYYSPLNLLVNILGPLLGFVGIILVLRKSISKEQNKNSKLCFLFLFLGLLLVLIDYRILKLFMVGVPFAPERIWLFRDFILTPFLAIIGSSTLLLLLRGRKPNAFTQVFTPSFSLQLFSKVSLKSILVYAFVLISLSSWITASLYYAYPHYGPLQITSYELEAVRHIEATTQEKYVVIADQWIILAAQMFVGVYNSHAYYFAHTDPRGVALLIEMRTNPTPETMVKAMESNNSTIAFFIIEKPRLGAEEYSRIIQQAQQNDLQTYRTFDYQGQEKLHIFIYQK